jgi:hypothetical protein
MLLVRLLKDLPRLFLKLLVMFHEFFALWRDLRASSRESADLLIEEDIPCCCGLANRCVKDYKNTGSQKLPEYSIPKWNKKEPEVAPFRQNRRREQEWK